MLLNSGVAFCRIPLSRNGGTAVAQSKIQQAKTLKDINPTYCKILQSPTATMWELDRRLNRRKAYLGVTNTLVLNKKEFDRSDYLQEDFDSQAEILETTLMKSGKSAMKFTSKGAGMSTAQGTFLKQIIPGDIVEVNITFRFKDEKPGLMHSGTFMFTVVPETEAVFPGGDKGILAYVEQELKKKSIELPEAFFARIVLEINENGRVEKVRMPEESRDKRIGNALISIFKSMPGWMPAKNKLNKPVNQYLEFLLGERGC